MDNKRREFYLTFVRVPFSLILFTFTNIFLYSFLSKRSNFPRRKFKDSKRFTDTFSGGEVKFFMTPVADLPLCSCFLLYHSVLKLITQHLVMNDAWSAREGKLRLVKIMFRHPVGWISVVEKFYVSQTIKPSDSTLIVPHRHTPFITINIKLNASNQTQTHTHTPTHSF